MKTVLLSALFLLMTFVSAMCFAQSGTLDPTFGSGGKVITSINTFGNQLNSLAVQTDGKILYGGFTKDSYITSDFALVRCLENGSLDPTFGNGGTVTTYVEDGSEAESIAIQNDGKILLGGHSSWFVNLVRYTADGSLDPTFGTNGKVITDVIGFYSEKCNSLMIQNDGKIVVGGYAMHNSNDQPYYLLLRYNADGTLDNTFGIDGVVMSSEGYAYAMDIQSDGKILLAGSYTNQFVVRRYLADGTLDNSFGTAGEIITTIGVFSQVKSIALQDDGKFILAGFSLNASNLSDFTLVRYASDGNVDTGFGNNGLVVTPLGFSNSQCNAIKIQSDGKIVATGYAKNSSNSNEFAMARYESNGIFDSNFGTNGSVFTSFGFNYSISTSMSIQNDGKILAGGIVYNGTSIDMALMRLESDAITGMTETKNQELYSIYPNPFNSVTTIQFSEQVSHPGIKLYNNTGQLMMQKEITSNQSFHLTRNELPSGMYFLHLMDEDKMMAIEKIILQ